MPPKKKFRPAGRSIGFKPKGAGNTNDQDEDSEDIQGFDLTNAMTNALTERVNNPFKVLGLRPASIDFHPNNPADRIYAWYMGGAKEELTEEDEWYHHVFKTAHSLQIEGETDSQIARTLKACFDLSSERLAYKYIYTASTLFGNVASSDKNALRHMLSQMARSCYAQALKDGDIKAALLAIRELKTINGLDREDAFLADPATLGGNTFVVQINMVAPNGESKSMTIDLNTINAEQEKFLRDSVNGMDQATDAEFLEILERSTDGEAE